MGSLLVTAINVGPNNPTTQLTCAYSECGSSRTSTITLTPFTYSITSAPVSQNSNVYTYKITSENIPYANSINTINGTVKLALYVSIDQMTNTVTLVTAPPQQPTSNAVLNIVNRYPCPKGAPPTSCSSVSGAYDNISLQLTNGNVMKLPLFTVATNDGHCAIPYQTK